MPSSWRRRRLRVPEGLVLHHGDIEDSDREWHDAVPLTSPLRTLGDCIAAHLSPELVEQAIEQARRRGLISGEDDRRLRMLLEESMEDRT